MTTPTEAMPLWAAPCASSAVNAVVEVPGSKSLTNRALMLAALGTGTARLRRPLHARDTGLMAAALAALGTDIDRDGGDYLVTPKPWNRPAAIDCGLAGNVMRFVPAASGLAEGYITFDGDPQARTRPLAPLLDALCQLGVSVLDDGRGALPFAIEGRGRVTGGRARVDASASSQFVTALLLSGCRYDNGLLLESVGPVLPSRPHIDMTVSLMRHCHVDVEQPDAATWVVPTTRPSVGDLLIEPDLSNAMPFLVAALITGGVCTVTGWPNHSLQPLGPVRQLVAALGGVLATTDGGLQLRADGPLTGADLDLSDIGELVPTVTAVATLANSPTTIRGVAHLRGHETDRLAALSEQYNALGGDVSQTDDGLYINPRPLHGGVFHTYHDHRMATAAALTGLVIPGVQVENVDTTAKTMPDFPSLWHHMLDQAAA